MPKIRTSRTHVFSSAFDEICSDYGPDSEGNKNIAKILCRNVRTIRDWRSGNKACPRWAYELIRLTMTERKAITESMFGRPRSNRTSHLIGMTRLSIALGVQFGTKSANDGFALPSALSSPADLSPA